MNPKARELTYTALSCLFSALISIGAFVAVPIPASPVPIVLQNMFIMLAALILGPWWGLLSTGIYLFLGLLGMPVFSGGAGGIAKLLGPTGGYLLGYLPATVVMGVIARKGGGKTIHHFIACFAGMAVVYFFGVWRLKSVLDAEWRKALAAGLYPFIIGDLIKMTLASLLAPRLLAGIEALVSRESDA